ncbi:hypothetical protein Tdes44962_MAKER01756 [Teratosphaeria destructans]|uniref:Transmembrane protein n=1 Tax=Teratosphaeria destructans TaxID=418781 RepID=A0A9W7W4W3_9PEZI|nr:hypothetical protein Tdes44962_MAKER01756 [Teratosphaeria destructans]
MSPLTRALYISLPLLMLTAVLELAFISSTVSWLHTTAGREFLINDASGPFHLHGTPANLLVNQGHTSNGAAGTAFVLVGGGGILALLLRGSVTRHPGSVCNNLRIAWYTTWLFLSLLSALLSLGALAYTFFLTAAHSDQSIDVAYAATLHSEPYSNYVAYDRDSWTPEDWFGAVLRLDLACEELKRDVEGRLVIMRAWRWNLIPLFAMGVFVAGLAVAEGLRWRRWARGEEFGIEREGKRLVGAAE